MQKRKSIKEQLRATTQDSKIATDKRLNQLDLNERISRAEAIVKGDKVKKSPTEKVIRDAFTMLQSDIKMIRAVKQRCQQAGMDANKSLIVRAGVKVLANMPIKDLQQVISSLPQVKVGRPKD